MIIKRLHTMSLIAAFAISFICFSGMAYSEEGVTDNEIVIGSIMDISGPIAVMGKGMSDGGYLYFKYINDNGGIHGRKIRMILEDDGYQVPRAIQACKKLVVRDKVFCIYAVLGSGECSAIYPYLSSRGIPLLIPATQNRDMGIPPKKYLFLADPTFTLQGKMGVEYIVDSMGVKNPKIACIYQDEISGQDYLKGVRIAARHYGLKVLELPYAKANVDFSSHIAKCKEEGITHIVMWALIREPAFIMKEAQRIQYKAVYVTSAASSSDKVPELAGNAIDYSNGLYLTSISSLPPAINSAGYMLYKQNVEKYKMCSAESTANMWGYQAAITLVEALKRAGKDLTREGIIKAMETFKNFDNGFLPPITWGPDDRIGSNAVKIFKFMDGRWNQLSNWRYSNIKEE